MVGFWSSVLCANAAISRLPKFVEGKKHQSNILKNRSGCVQSITMVENLSSDQFRFIFASTWVKNIWWMIAIPFWGIQISFHAWYKEQAQHSKILEALSLHIPWPTLVVHECWLHVALLFSCSSCFGYLWNPKIIGCAHLRPGLFFSWRLFLLLFWLRLTWQKPKEDAWIWWIFAIGTVLSFCIA